MAFSWGCVPLPRPELKFSHQKKTKSVEHAPLLVNDEPETSKPPPYYVLGRWYQPLADARDFRQRGTASWYGDKFQGLPTASGEIFNMNRISAAHKTLPLGTKVTVINLENKQKLDVIINDRGPFVAGRIIDLSKAAAQKIGVYQPGTALVEIITKAAPLNGNFVIQVGAFEARQNADVLKTRLSSVYPHAHTSQFKNHTGKIMYRVLVGQCTTLHQARKYKTYLISKGFQKAFIIAK